jgi:SAM-dependent methyltransferase
MDPLATFYPAHEQWLAPLLEELGLVACLERGAAVLEIGCGRGRTLAWLARRFPRCEVFGVDIEPVRAAAARSLLAESGRRAVVEVGDATTFTTDRGFALVLFHLALHDMVNAEDALRHALPMRAPAGRVVVVEIPEYLRDIEMLVRGGLARASLRIDPESHVITAFSEPAA